MMVKSTDNHHQYLIGCGVRSDDLETFKGLATLAEQGVIDHIQVLVVPGPEPEFRSRIETMAAYDALCILHAPHHPQGVNPCFPSAVDPENPGKARKCLESALGQTFQMADELRSPMIVLHAGHYPKGMQEEAFLGFFDFLDNYFDPRYILENLPEVFRDLIFIGTSAPDLVRLSNGKIKGYCLDFPHLYCTANYWGRSFERELMKFESLPVSLHHLSNSRKSSFRDEHLPLDHPEGGLDFDLIMNWISRHPGIQTSLEYKYNDIGIYYNQIREFKRLFQQYQETTNHKGNGQF
jgi:sugar phosphate isomerase/epimerase